MLPELIIQAWRSLLGHRLRSILTMLGVLIGVAAVVVMLGIGRGIRIEVERSITSLGSQLLIIVPGSASSGGRMLGVGTRPSITIADAESIADLASITMVAPVVQRSIQVVGGESNWQTSVMGTTPAYFKIRDWPTQQGGILTRDENERGKRVAVLGSRVAEVLFGDQVAVGQSIRLGQLPFLVIGVLTTKGQAGSRSEDDVVMVPLTTAQRQLKGTLFPGRVDYIMAQARPEAGLDEAQESVKNIMRANHGLASGKDDDFMIHNMEAAARVFQRTMRSFSILLGAIASISLLVGGIGIMNIMLVSVTERTSEIGLRMAIGARNIHILIQFLVESALLSFMGSIAGLILAVLSAYAIAVGLKTPVALTLTSMLWACAIAAMIGIAFGYYPARRAAALTPAEALRSD